MRDLSKRMSGATAAFLSDVELGRRHPSEKTLAQLASVLDTTVEDLRSHDSRPPVEEMRRLAAENPALGMAFRRIAELPPEQVLEFVKKAESDLRRKKP